MQTRFHILGGVAQPFFCHAEDGAVVAFPSIGDVHIRNLQLLFQVWDKEATCVLNHEIVDPDESIVIETSNDGFLIRTWPSLPRRESSRR